MRMTKLEILFVNRNSSLKNVVVGFYLFAGAIR